MPELNGLSLPLASNDGPEKMVVRGGYKLEGEVRISGAKNAALPIMVATLLTDEVCLLDNIPRLEDINTVILLIEHLGKRVKRDGNKIEVSSGLKIDEAPYDLVRKMRASVLVSGPLLSRLGKARIPLPGGCAIGPRPIDIHLKGFEKLGAQISLKDGFLKMESSRLKSGRICFDFPSVGATENILMVSALVEGETVIENAAREPEVTDLANFLIRMGARIEGVGTDCLKVQGRKKLHGTKYTVIPDRIEAGTFMIATALTRGKTVVSPVLAQHLESLTAKLEEAGVKVKFNHDTVSVIAPKILKSTRIETLPFPGFPTDLQSLWTVLMSLSDSDSLVVETIFENRFVHIGELQRMGADIRIKGKTVLVKGVKKLSGAPVVAPDLRASAALILAGLVAEGKTEVTPLEYLDRGYEDFAGKLRKLGAKIERIV